LATQAETLGEFRYPRTKPDVDAAVVPGTVSKGVLEFRTEADKSYELEGNH
jgi:hypothetical protein